MTEETLYSHHAISLLKKYHPQPNINDLFRVTFLLNDGDIEWSFVTDSKGFVTSGVSGIEINYRELDEIPATGLGVPVLTVAPDISSFEDREFIRSYTYDVRGHGLGKLDEGAVRFLVGTMIGLDLRYRDPEKAVGYMTLNIVAGEWDHNSFVIPVPQFEDYELEVEAIREPVT